MPALAPLPSAAAELDLDAGGPTVTLPRPTQEALERSADIRMVVRLGLNGSSTSLWAGQLISLFGDRIHQLALAAAVLITTGSALATALVFVTATIPNLLFSPIAGTLVDRLDGSSDRLYGGSMARLGSFFPLLAWNPGEGWQTDPPSSIGWEAWTSPTADFDVKVTAPRGLQVLASGEQVSSGRWRVHGVRDFALAVGRLTVVHGTAAAPGRVRLIVGVERGTRASARRYLGWARAALEAHARRFGPYPWSTFSLVGTEMDRFSWEYPTLAFGSTNGPTPRQGTAHEIAHQWFYSLVGNNQARDPWLDEALATWGDARFTSRLAELVADPIPEPVRNQLGRPMRFWDEFDIAMFIDGTYNQGVQALASLGEPEAVDCALRLYALENAYEIADPVDLLRALERFFPDAQQKLEAFGARF